MTIDKVAMCSKSNYVKVLVCELIVDSQQSWHSVCSSYLPLRNDESTFYDSNENRISSIIRHVKRKSVIVVGYHGAMKCRFAIFLSIIFVMVHDSSYRNSHFDGESFCLQTFIIHMKIFQCHDSLNNSITQFS